MRPEDLVFWLDVLRDEAEVSSGVLCLRHADTMVVPRNWTLDDLRDPDLHLFRPPPAADTHRPRSRRTRSGDDTAEQLRLGALADEEVDTLPPPDAAPEPIDDDTPWAPSFDHGDDLDGLLSARSPLLSRAFRGDDLPRR